MKTCRTMQLLLMLLLILLLCAGCSGQATPAEPAITADNCDITANLDAVEDLTVTPNLIAQFYAYYQQHYYELTYLPNFSAENAQPDWDALSLYILLRFEYDDKDPSAPIWQLSDIQFKETMQKHMQPVIYTNQPSSYLEYENGIYTADGFDLNGVTYYRLIDIAKDDQNIYTATFDMLSFAESELLDPEISLNAHSVLNYAQIVLHQDSKEISANGRKFSSVIESIFLQDDYADILDLSGKVTIQFTLTGDSESPFYYISCSWTEK